MRRCQPDNRKMVHPKDKIYSESETRRGQTFQVIEDNVAVVVAESSGITVLVLRFNSVHRANRESDGVEETPKAAKGRGTKKTWKRMRARRDSDCDGSGYCMGPKCEVAVWRTEKAIGRLWVCRCSFGGLGSTDAAREDDIYRAGKCEQIEGANVVSAACVTSEEEPGSTLKGNAEFKNNNGSPGTKESGQCGNLEEMIIILESDHWSPTGD
ncbi:hypothetical protein B0J11DRAFT_224371 [Dendryphion nanum]|uniref:Uncharacterized protein n=1 Tax=Dendryphion nanum TaxID=256645 RepID=A0A9P9E9B5_9PLEO|nr:hypothetical protein B0J11DRAFT_224371 [Dendryphion nanum]